MVNSDSHTKRLEQSPSGTHTSHSPRHIKGSKVVLKCIFSVYFTSISIHLLTVGTSDSALLTIVLISLLFVPPAQSLQA